MNDLENVEAGDEVVYWPGDEWLPPEIVVVDRTTKTQIMAAAKHWRRKTGREVGEEPAVWSRNRERIEPVNDETRRQVAALIAQRAEDDHRRNLRDAIVGTIRREWECLPLETLEQVAEMLKAAQLEAGS
ncbi:MAG: hypothetical protein M0R22_07555 [Dehalococcoidia bacterium]|jgi:hypothetical protein|nr:hypothetical protein [Dehalococcoidia bacterium]